MFHCKPTKRSRNYQRKPKSFQSEEEICDAFSGMGHWDNSEYDPNAPPRQLDSVASSVTPSSARSSSNVSPVNINGTVYYQYTVSNNVFTPYTVDFNCIPERTLYPMVREVSHNPSQLIENGYPYFATENCGHATIEKTIYDMRKKIWVQDDDKTRVCNRCHMEIELNEDGSVDIYPGQCWYKPRGSSEYVSADSHVFDQVPERVLQQFLQTPSPFGPNDPRSKKVYALDCEFVYTLDGPALARLSVVDANGQVVLDVFVRPSAQIIDYNTEFSGITAYHMQNATDDINTVRQRLFHLINSETVLVGHSLESDLKALRVVHLNVLDTALLYSHNGSKKGLKFLASTYLLKVIQQDHANGHDSVEDARTCMELLKYYITFRINH